MLRFEGKCKSASEVSSHDPVAFQSLAGVFYILLATVGFSLVILLVEWIVAAIQDMQCCDLKVQPCSKKVNYEFEISFRKFLIAEYQLAPYLIYLSISS